MTNPFELIRKTPSIKVMPLAPKFTPTDASRVVLTSSNSELPPVRAATFKLGVPVAGVPETVIVPVPVILLCVPPSKAIFVELATVPFKVSVFPLRDKFPFSNCKM